MIIELLVVALLILLNGLFSMAELAVVSARRGLLEQEAEAGSKGARAALQLADSPGRFLSTVQFGITLVGVLAGAFSGATLSEPLALWLADFPTVAAWAEPLALTVVVSVITYFSIVIGELIPKQFALRHAETIAALVARPMDWLSRFAHPVVSLLDSSANMGLRLLGQSAVAEQTVSEEEVRRLIAEGMRTGVFARAEKEMIDRVMSLADRPVRAVMTPRLDVEWLDANKPAQELLAALRASSYSRLPLCRGSIEEVIGIVQAKDVLDRHFDGEAIDFVALARPAPIVPDTAGALQVLEALKSTPTNMAIVVDEYGALEGLLSQSDILESIVGSMPGATGLDDQPDVIERPDGTLLVDAAMGVDEARYQLGLPPLPDGGYHTLAGFALEQMRTVPSAGDWFEWEGWRFEVIDMDGRRIDKLLVTRPAPAADEADDGA